MNIKKPRNLGKIHALLVQRMPEWVDDQGFLRTYDLAAYLGISYQALYKIFERDRIAPKRAKALILLSRGNIKYEDFVEFM